MKNSDLISIIVPVYNVEKYLKRCMDTLQNQTYENIEIILVDDGSPDDCPQLCDEYARKDSRVKVIHKSNEGLGMARNSGFEIATGSYIVFVDSDDYVTEDMCEKLYSATILYNADVVYGGVYYDNNGKVKCENNTFKEKIWQGDEVRSFLLDLIATEPNVKRDTVMEVSVWKAMFKRTLFDKYNIRFESERKYISEDVIFDIDYISKAQCVVWIASPVYYYCVNPDSLSKTFRTDRFQKVKVLYQEIKRRLMPFYDSKVIELRSDRFLIARARTNAKQIIHHRSVIGKKSMRQGLKAIWCDNELQIVLDRYPIIKLPIKYGIIAWCMKYKLYFFIEIILGEM